MRSTDYICSNIELNRYQGAEHRNIQTIMADTYTQCYFHLVFAVKNRDALIKKSWKNDLEKYITGITQNHKHKILAIRSMPDHIHIFIGYNVNQLIPDLVEEIKTSSNTWMHTNNLIIQITHLFMNITFTVNEVLPFLTFFIVFIIFRFSSHGIFIYEKPF